MLDFSLKMKRDIALFTEENYPVHGKVSKQTVSDSK